MPVGSTIELYTTMLAWLMYEGLWDLMASTGILMVPFIVAIVQLIMDDNVSKTDVSSFVNALENRLYLMIFMMFFASAPYINLYSTKMSYTDVTCAVEAGSIEKQTNDVLFEDTGTNADVASERYMSSVANTTPRMPMWWYFWGRISIAFTTTLKTILPCNPDFRTMSEGLGNVLIVDQDLKSEVSQFHEDCWKPGVMRYWRDLRNGSYVSNGGVDDQDIAWLGSSILLKDSRYYPELRAETPVKYWPYRETVDNNKSTKEDAGGNGYPYCDEWWQGPPSSSSYGYEGLKDRLYEHITSRDDFSHIKSWWDYYWNKSSELGDADKINFVVRTALTNTETQLNIQMNRSTDADMLDHINNFVGNAGIALKGIGNRAEANVYRSAGPIIQALLLMLFVMFLPILLTVSLFDAGKILTLSMIYFTLIFWGYLFELADYIDNFLLSAFISSNETTFDNLNALSIMGPSGVSAKSIITLSNNDTMAVEVFRWISRMLYVILPGVFSWLIAAAGMRVGGYISNGISTMGAAPAQAAQSGADTATSIAKKVITKK